MDPSLSNYLSERQQLINSQLIERINLLNSPKSLKASMLYSVEAGGKRLRPIIMMAACEAYDKEHQLVLSPAVALEMVHTYSLIHDDLPSMDNDDFRRGKPTNHKVFDEATSILAGDALLTCSFQQIAEDYSLSNEQKVFLINNLSKASGPIGMVGGQLLDMEAEDKQTDLDELEQIHTLKTGQLLSFAVVAGAYVGGANDSQITYLKDFAYYLGLVFQVQDDILDVSGDPLLLGKTVGSDEKRLKSTYPKLLGLEGAIKQKEHYVQKAKSALKSARVEHTVLAAITDHLAKRDR